MDHNEGKIMSPADPKHVSDYFALRPPSLKFFRIKKQRKEKYLTEQTCQGKRK